ncbi:MAG: hypothetical protein M1825_002982 [Sarcosagium campestre]|nr:MAG: hypothetical protein M1825_002982 [Sarcosagium campestre]
MPFPRRMIASHVASHLDSSDTIFIRNIALDLPVGTDAFGRIKSQPVLISITVYLRSKFDTAAGTDSVDESTIHYGKLSKAITASLNRSAGTAEQNGASLSLKDVTAQVEEAVFAANEPLRSSIRAWCIEIQLPKASLLGSGVQFTYLDEHRYGESTLTIRDINVPAIIGVNAHEREAKQRVVVNVGVESYGEAKINGRYVLLEKTVVAAIEETSFETLEALVTHIMSRLMKNAEAFNLIKHDRLRVRAEKPSAISSADAPGVEITRNFDT